jgi:hypothetical protein
MKEPHDPNRTVDVPSGPADSLDAGLAAGVAAPHSGPGDRQPVPLKEAEGDLPAVPPSAVESLLFAALALPTAAERAAFLNLACAGDAELHRQVETLLQAHANAGDFLNKPVVDLLAAAPQPPHEPSPTTDHGAGGPASRDESNRTTPTAQWPSLAAPLQPRDLVEPSRRVRAYGIPCWPHSSPARIRHQHLLRREERDAAIGSWEGCRLSCEAALRASV